MVLSIAVLFVIAKMSPTGKALCLYSQLSKLFAKLQIVISLLTEKANNYK